MSYVSPTCPKCGNEEDAIRDFPATREEPGWLEHDPPDECSSDECDWKMGDKVEQVYSTFANGERITKKRIVDDWEWS
jgi:hypothetical protein